MSWAGALVGLAVRLRRAKTCWLVIAHWRRPWPMKAISQLNKTAARFLKPVRTSVDEQPHQPAGEAGQAQRPGGGDGTEPGDGSHGAQVPVAERPLRGVTAEPAAVAAAACRADCMATSATPGSLSRLIRSPTTKISGWPATVQSGCTWTPPARSVPAPVAVAAIRPSGAAATPAAQILVRAGMRRSAARQLWCRCPQRQPPSPSRRGGSLRPCWSGPSPPGRPATRETGPAPGAAHPAAPPGPWPG